MKPFTTCLRTTIIAAALAIVPVYSQTTITPDMLVELPKPSSKIIIVPPVQRIREQIQTVENMANSGNAALYPYMRETLLDLSGSQIVKSHSGLRAAVLASAKKAGNLQQVKEQLGTPLTSSSEEILKLLDEQSLTPEHQIKLIVNTSTLNLSAREALLKETKIKHLISAMKEEIVYAIEDQDFRTAATIIELAITAFPSDTDLQLLKGHLEN